MIRGLLHQRRLRPSSNVTPKYAVQIYNCCKTAATYSYFQQSLIQTVDSALKFSKKTGYFRGEINVRINVFFFYNLSGRTDNLTYKTTKVQNVAFYFNDYTKYNVCSRILKCRIRRSCRCVSGQRARFFKMGTDPNVPCVVSLKRRMNMFYERKS